MTKFNVGDIVRVVSAGLDCGPLVGFMFKVHATNRGDVVLDVTSAHLKVKGYEGWSLGGGKYGWYVEDAILELAAPAKATEVKEKKATKRATPVDKKALSPQCQQLLSLLQDKGSVTALEAGGVYRIRALPRRIADLKEAGYTIVRDLNTDTTGQRYARYYLKGTVA